MTFVRVTPLILKMMMLMMMMMILPFKTEAQDRGRRCTAPDGRQGTCVSILICPQAKALLLRIIKKEATPDEIKRYICQPIGHLPLVCCAAQPSQPPSRFTSTSVGQDHNQPVSGSTSLLPTRCGRKVPFGGFAVTNGYDSTLGYWPWIVLLRGRVNGQKSDWFCGGTIISDRYVLTAAHCVDETSRVQLEYARIGEFNLQESADCKFRHTCAPEVQDIPVERIIVHPSYNEPCNRCNDIALLRLNSKISLESEYVQPICLPLNPEELLGYGVEEFLSKTGYAAGWGTISKNPNENVIPDILQEVDLPIQNLPFCDELKKTYPHPSMVFCAGGENKDTCRGDSGGPLVLYQNFSTPSVLVGITSKGPNVCGAASTQGLYTSVHHYLPWIISCLRP